jgi:hypothetical protein
VFQRESLLQELVLSLALAGRERDALDELELCGSLFFLALTHNLTRAMQLPPIAAVPRQLRVAYLCRPPLFTTGAISGDRLTPLRPR